MSAAYQKIVNTLDRCLGCTWRFVSTSFDERSGLVLTNRGDTYKWILDPNGNVGVVLDEMAANHVRTTT